MAGEGDEDEEEVYRAARIVSSLKLNVDLSAGEFKKSV